MIDFKFAAWEPRSWQTVLLAAVLALYINISAYPPSFEPVYSVYADISNYYWIQSFLDSRLFSHDALTALIKSRMPAFAIEMAGIWFTSIFMRTSPYTIGLKVLSVILLTSSALMIRRLARVSGAYAISAAVVAFFMGIFLSMDTFHGVTRAYGAVILLGFFIALQQKRFLLLSPIIMMGFVFYSPTTVCLGASAAAVPLFYRKDFNKKLLFLYAAGLLTATLFIMAVKANSFFMGNFAASCISGQLQNYKFSQLVSSPLDPRSPLVMFLYFVLNFNEHGRLYPLMFTLLAATAAAGFLKSPGCPKFLPKAFKPILTGSATAFAVLYFIHPVMASRQFVFVIPLLLVFLSAEGLERLTGPEYRFPALATIVLLFICLNPFLTEVRNCRHYMSAYNYLSATKTDSVIAAYPDSMLAETIPIFSKRESFLGYSQDDLQVITHGSDGFETRATDLLRALYLGEKQMKEFSEYYGVDYLVLEREYYDESYMKQIKTSPQPQHLRLIKVLNETTENPENIYQKAKGMAVFSWTSNDKEGFIVDLHKFKISGPTNKEELKKHSDKNRR